MTDPLPLGAGFAELVRNFPPEHRLHDAGVQAMTAATECAERRARVLKHDDLAAKLTERPIGYADAGQWNGWVPPRVMNPEGQPEACLIAYLETGGGFRYRFNQLGRRTRGEQLNESPRRTALIEIAVEAWLRRREETP